MQCTTPNRKESTHERIAEAAACAIRRSGYGGTGVADIMKDAGLTHGGFYAHFDSREAMLAEAADRAGAEGVVRDAAPSARGPARRESSHLGNDRPRRPPIARLGTVMRA